MKWVLKDEYLDSLWGRAEVRKGDLRACEGNQGLPWSFVRFSEAREVWVGLLHDLEWLHKQLGQLRLKYHAKNQNTWGLTSYSVDFWKPHLVNYECESWPQESAMNKFSRYFKYLLKIDDSWCMRVDVCYNHLESLKRCQSPDPWDTTQSSLFFHSFPSASHVQSSLKIPCLEKWSVHCFPFLFADTSPQWHFRPKSHSPFL